MVVCDLDETLIHYNVETDWASTRPGAVEMLQFIHKYTSGCVRVDIYTRGGDDYAAAIATLLEKLVGNGFHFGQVISREMLGPKMEKSLAAGGWNGNNVIILDDTVAMWKPYLSKWGKSSKNKVLVQVEAYEGWNNSVEEFQAIARKFIDLA